MIALYQPFQNRTIPCPAPPHLPPLSKGGGLTASHKLSLCCVLLATRPPFYSLNFSAVKTEGLLYHPSLSTTSMPPLSKVRCSRPKKFGRLPEGLLHHPSHNYNKPLLRHHSSQRRQLTRIGKHKKNPHCLFLQWGFGLIYRFYFKYLPTSTAGAEVSGAGLPEQSSVYPPTEIPVILPLPSSVSV